MVGLVGKKRHLGRELAEGLFLPTAYHFIMHTCDFAGAGATSQRRLSFHGMGVPFGKGMGGGANIEHRPLGAAVDTPGDDGKVAGAAGCCRWGVFPGCGLMTGQLYCKSLLLLPSSISTYLFASLLLVNRHYDALGFWTMAIVTAFIVITVIPMTYFSTKYL